MHVRQVNFVIAKVCLINELTKKLVSLSNKELSELKFNTSNWSSCYLSHGKLAKEKTAFFPPK